MNKYVIIRAVFSLFFIADSIASSLPQTTASIPIPQEIVSKIVVQTLQTEKQSRKSTLPDVPVRLQQVVDFLTSVGGNAWYKNYVNEMAAPKGQTDVTEISGVSDAKLEYYYIHPPLVSGENLLKFNCLKMDASCGLANYDAYHLTGNKQFYHEFLSWADLLVQSQKNGRWELVNNIPTRNIKAPWISGQIQSFGLSLMLRAYQSTHDKKYLAAAQKALKWFEIPSSKQGLAVKTFQRNVV